MQARLSARQLIILRANVDRKRRLVMCLTVSPSPRGDKCISNIRNLWASAHPMTRSGDVSIRALPLSDGCCDLDKALEVASMKGVSLAVQVLVCSCIDPAGRIRSNQRQGKQLVSDSILDFNTSYIYNL